jgi:hypothetical protein
VLCNHTLLLSAPVEAGTVFLHLDRLDRRDKGPDRYLDVVDPCLAKRTLKFPFAHGVACEYRRGGIEGIAIVAKLEITVSRLRMNDRRDLA